MRGLVRGELGYGTRIHLAAFVPMVRSDQAGDRVCPAVAGQQGRIHAVDERSQRRQACSVLVVPSSRPEHPCNIDARNEARDTLATRFSWPPGLAVPVT